MAKVVIDANVIISAAFGGNPLKAVIRAMKEDKVYFSESIQEEINRVFLKLSNKLTEEQLEFLQEKMRELMQLAEIVEVTKRVTISRDPKDDHYLALCREIGADFLITGDKDLLSIPFSKLKQHGIHCKILQPLDFLERP
jgi:putative PIN family toxin of toxin-antitoxin system